MRAIAFSASVSLREEGARRFVNEHAVGVCLYNLRLAEAMLCQRPTGVERCARTPMHPSVLLENESRLPERGDTEAIRGMPDACVAQTTTQRRASAKGEKRKPGEGADPVYPWEDESNGGGRFT